MISCCHASRNPDHEGRCGKPKSCVLPDFGGLQAPRGPLRLWMEIKTCFAWIAWLEVDVGDQVIVLCAMWLLDMSPWLQGAARFRSLFFETRPRNEASEVAGAVAFFEMGRQKISKEFSTWDRRAAAYGGETRTEPTAST